MADRIIQTLKGQEVHDLRIPRYDTASMFTPVAITNNQGEKILVPRDQKSGVEQVVFWQLYSPNITNLTSLAGSSVGMKDAGPMIAQWQIKEADLNVADMILELQGTYPDDSGGANPAGVAFVPGPLWLDRIEFACDGQPYFQRLYADILFRLMIASLPPHKLYLYALQSGGWLNPPTCPGAQVMAANNNAATWYQNQLAGAGGMCIFPFQLKATAAQSITNASTVYNASKQFCIRIPLFGSFLQQAGFFQFKWIEGGTFYVTVYGSARPAYITAYDTSNAKEEIVLTTVNLWLKCLSFLPGTSAQAMLQDVNENTRYDGLHIQYLDYLRTTQSVTVANSATQYLTLDFTSGRHVAFLIATARPTTQSTNSASYWKLGTDGTGSNGIPVITTGAVGRQGREYDGTFHRTHMGTNSNSGPYVDLLDPNNNIIFTNNQSCTIEQLQQMWNGPKVITNPWTLGLISGAPSYSPLGFIDIPFQFGNMLSAAQGIYDGSFEFPINSRIRLQYASALADTGVGSYDIIAATWRTLHISRNNGRMRAEDDPMLGARKRRR